MLRTAVLLFCTLLPVAAAAQAPPADGGPRDWLRPDSVVIAAAPDWTETLSLFAGISGAKQPQDLGVNAHFGGRLAANAGFPVYEPWNLGGQVGLAGVYQDDAVRVFEALGADSDRGQLFGTAGLFQKNELWNWSFVYDALYQDQYDTATLTQFRGRVGLHLTDRDEVGVWGTKNDRGADVEFLATPLEIKPISQVNLFWRHQYESGAYTTLWGGVAEGHAEMVLLLPGDSHLSTSPVFGADFRAPLNDYASPLRRGELSPARRHRHRRRVFRHRVLPRRGGEDVRETDVRPDPPPRQQPQLRGRRPPVTETPAGPGGR